MSLLLPEAGMLQVWEAEGGSDGDREQAGYLNATSSSSGANSDVESDRSDDRGNGVQAKDREKHIIQKDSVSIIDDDLIQRCSEITLTAAAMKTLTHLDLHLR